jgi:hypothetical protein
MTEPTIECAGCKRQIDRTVPGPCPHCGSRTRALSLHSVVTMVAQLAAKWPKLPKSVRRKWGELATRFQKDGSGLVVHFRREFDKDADRYFEHVEEAETGKVIVHKEERLTKHQGHGSAKRP